jgi:hypothetical protein
MFRAVLIASAAIFFAAAPAAAATYSAKLSSPASGHIVARDMNWACAGESCQGATDESRPVVLCQALAKQAGKVESFAVDGRAFGSAELDKCNAAAKPQAGKALASQ